MQQIDLSICLDLTTIGDYAFSNCRSLQEIKLPSSSSTKLITIGKYAFESMVSLLSIFIPSSLQTIGEGAFRNCSEITNITFDPGVNVMEISHYVFSFCSNLPEITIPASVKSIGDPFEKCDALQYIYVDSENTNFYDENGVVYSKDDTTICYFPNGRNGSYTIPNDVGIIRDWCFITSRISELTMPNSVYYIGTYCFASSSISNIIFSTNLQKLKDNAFNGCLQLETIVLPEGLIELGATCFNGCSKLKSIQLPSTLTTIGGGTFNGCSPDLNIDLTNNQKFSFHNGQLINKQEHQFIMYTGAETELTIDDSIQIIGQNCFESKTFLTSVIFTDNSQLKQIGGFAFQGCTSLVSINFPPNLTTIGFYSFNECHSLASIEINSPLTSIETYAFHGCVNLTSLKITTTRDLEIGANAFEKCSSLSTITINGGLTKLNYSSFAETGPIEELTLPNSLQVIEHHAFYKSKIKKVSFLESSMLTELPEFSFSDCEYLVEFNFPDSLETLGQNCLSNTRLKTIEIPTKTKYLGEFCFSDNPNLINFTIPEGSELVDIAFGVFSGCSSFEKIENHCDNFLVENTALYNVNQTEFIILPPNSPIVYFSFPSTLKSIKPAALRGCKNIQIIFIPSNSVEEIGRSAFENCYNLRQINFPLSIKNIQSNLFNGCKKLQCGLLIENKNIEFINTLIEIGKLPRKCVSDCQDCTCNINIHSFRASICFIVVFISRSF